MTGYQRPEGTHDILPEDQAYWYDVRDRARALAEPMGFERIDIPTFEYAAVFAKTAAGEGTGLSEEMYPFEDKDGQVWKRRKDRGMRCLSPVRRPLRSVGVCHNQTDEYNSPRLHNASHHPQEA